MRYPITLHGQILTRVNRTPDKWIYSPLLYQLSYSEKKKKVPPGLEPGSSDSKSEVLTITPRNLKILRKVNTVDGLEINIIKLIIIFNFYIIFEK